MSETTNSTSARPNAPLKASKRSVAEKLMVAERLRDLQRALAPVRAANKAKRATGKPEIRFKTK
jgi:hypothetical protein